MVSSGGGVSQVKDTGHNGMESIGICLSVLTLSIFLVREIRTDKHPHHSPLPHTHTLQSQAQSHRTAPQTTNEIGPREGERRTRAQANTRALLPSGPAPTPQLRLLTPKNCRDWAGAEGAGGGKCGACPEPAANPPPESGPRPPLFKGAFCSADEEQQCGPATTRALGTLRGRREAGLEGAGHSHPLPSLAGGGGGRPAAGTPMPQI